MVKKGIDRSKKFNAKHDPDALLLRWKTLQNLSVIDYSGAASSHVLQDILISELIKLFNLPYGMAGKMHDKFKKLIYDWDLLNDTQKEFFRQDWINEGLPSEVFDKITEYVEEFKKLTEKERFRTGCLQSTLKFMIRSEDLMFPEIEDYTLLTEAKIKEIIEFLIEENSYGLMFADVSTNYSKDKVENSLENPSIYVEDLFLIPEIVSEKTAYTPNMEYRTIPKSTCKLESLEFESSLRNPSLALKEYKGLISELRMNHLISLCQNMPKVQAFTVAPLKKSFLNPTIEVQVSAPPPPIPTEQIVNGGFETGDLTGWISLFGNVVTDHPHNGNYCTRLLYQAEMEQTFIKPISVNAISYFALWIYGHDVLGQSSNALIVVWYEDGTAWFTYEDAPNDAWRKIEILSNLDPTKKVTKIYIRSWVDLATDLWVDDVSLMAYV